MSTRFRGPGRGLLIGLLAAGHPLGPLRLHAGAAEGTLPAWTPGTLDIHHLATGRGNSTLILAPDGTSLLIDAGAASGTPDVSCPPKPDGSRRPGEWIARYAARQLRATGRVQLDYLIATHLHPDHIGDVGPATPPAKSGTHLLTGITDVAEAMPVRLLIDRGFPDYNFPSRWQAGFALNYFSFVAARQQAGGACERIRVGTSRQIRLAHAPGEFPAFSVRTIAANGTIWNGAGEDTRSLVPPAPAGSPGDLPDENFCSIALRLSYGRFDYYTGGDLHCDTYFGQQPWRDLETPVAVATGPVEVAVTNHHAYFDAVGPESVRALRPLVWVTPAWHITHLNIAALERMLSERLYAGPRDVFVTDLMPATALANQRFLPKVKSTAGHVIIRVAPGGDQFRVFITGNGDESDRITASFGPYACRPDPAR